MHDLFGMFMFIGSAVGVEGVVLGDGLVTTDKTSKNISCGFDSNIAALQNYPSRCFGSLTRLSSVLGKISNGVIILSKNLNFSPKENKDHNPYITPGRGLRWVTEILNPQSRLKGSYCAHE